MATATATRTRRHGRWGKRLKLFDLFEDWSNDDEIQEAVQERMEIGEAETRADFAEFLAGAIRTATLRGYKYATPQWDKYMGVESAQDFREHRAKGLSGMSGIHHLGELGEYKEMRRARRPVPTYAVDTYGATYAISRHLIINDDTKQILTTTPDEMGKAMGRFVTRTAVALIESNPNAPDGAPVYSVARGNETTAALSEDALADVFDAMEVQFDDNGDEILMTPSVITVKNLKLQLIAKRIVRSQETGTTINYTGGAAGVGSDRFDKGNYNPLAEMFSENGVVRDPYFQDPNDYYVFADPGETPAFIMAFLNGERDPFIGMKNPEVRGALPQAGDDPYTYEMDTIDYKIRHDFGAAVVDPRGTARGRVA